LKKRNDNVNARRKAVTPGDVAEMYGVSLPLVLGWIARRELPAVNVASRKNGGRAQWAIMPEDLAAFEAGRRTQPKPSPVPRQRKLRQSAVTEYY
jgi:hypothetical protein